MEAQATSQKCSSTQWIRKISQLQAANATPEFLAEAKRKAERSARLTKSCKKAGKLQTSNVIAQRVWNTSMTEMAETKSAPAASESERSSLMLQSSAIAKSRLETVQRVTHQSDDSEGEAELDSIALDIGLQTMTPVEALEEEGQLQMRALLEQLYTEPAEEAELQCKFVLFENYLATIEKMRAETFAFWDEAKNEFHASASADIQRILSQVDGHENLAIEFVEGRWFVYDMTNKAGTNSAMIGRILAMIKARLELLARAEDCPICLEGLEVCGEEPHVLGCCHKVCRDCWSHWSQLQGSRAFCPLCRNEEFLGDLMRRQSTLEQE